MLIATQLNFQKNSSFWNVSQSLPYDVCVHHDDAEAIDSTMECTPAGNTNHIYAVTSKDTTQVYPTDSEGQALSATPLFTITRRESWLYNNHREIIQMLFDSQQIKYLDAQCDFDNWHSHEHI
jgi:hypothetical protein